ncbi:MAG: hypothetical protein RLZZ204_630 [Bacteroidota bacterium]|jgi:hypothetical protein
MRNLFLLLVLLFISCEKDITIKLDPSQTRLVVDASIENEQPPIVFLSQSLDFFGKINPTILSASLVRNAKISITDGTSTVTLTEDSVVRGNTKVYFYTTSGTNQFFRGRLGAKYNLRIEAMGNIYTASTSIPQLTRKVDSLYWDKVPLADDSNDVRLMLTGTDQPGLGDYIRYFTKRGQEPFLAGFNSAFDDQIIDGTTYTVQVDKGFDKNAEFADSLSFFKRGDTVTLKLCNIDKGTYDFWRTYEFSFQSIGNPFSSPTKILGNISNDALGYFGGYGAQYHTIIIPK